MLDLGVLYSLEPGRANEVQGCSRAQGACFTEATHICQALVRSVASSHGEFPGRTQPLLTGMASVEWKPMCVMARYTPHVCACAHTHPEFSVYKNCCVFGGMTIHNSGKDPHCVQISLHGWQRLLPNQSWPRGKETRNVLPDKEGVVLSGRCWRPHGGLHDVRKLKCER